MHAAKGKQKHIKKISLLIRSFLLLRALEDGATLGTLLSRIYSKLQIPAVTSLYEKKRKERTKKIREETFKQQEEHHLAAGELQEGRDRHLARSFDHQDVW